MTEQELEELIAPDTMGHRLIAIQQNEARAMGLCSVCEEPTARESLDSSARCQECQP